MFKRFALSVVLFSVSGILTLGMSVPASAHAALTNTDPEDGAVLTEVPTQVTFTFSEVLKEPGFAAVSRDGDEVSGWTYALDAEKLVVIPPQDEEVPAGDYVVSFRVVSADGHPIKGSTTFTLDIEHSEPADTTDEADTADDANASDDSESEESGGLVEFLKAPWVWGGVVVIIAIVAAAVVRRRGAATNND